MIEQFDFIESNWQAEKGMTLANGAQRVQKWKEDAERYFRTKLPGDEFSADDLIKKIGTPSEGPNQNNVVGAWFNAKCKARLICFTGRMKKSSRVDRHTGLQRVWSVQ